MKEDQRPYWLPRSCATVAALVNDHEGNISAAARAVDCDRTTIIRWLDHEEVDRIGLFVPANVAALVQRDPRGAVEALARWAEKPWGLAVWRGSRGIEPDS